MEERRIEFKSTGRYSILGNPGPHIKKVWFVCHGYGQLARYFIHKFRILDDGTCLIVAPEGLSKFYLQGFSGRVGATWMTREDRENDILNYITYLEAVGKDVLQSLPQDVHITLLGFSQGAATVARWITTGSLEINRLIMWAGIFPEDLDVTTAKGKLLKTETYVLAGNQDQFITPESLERLKQINQKLEINPKIIRFDGGHDIPMDELKRFL